MKAVKSITSEQAARLIELLENAQADKKPTEERYFGEQYYQSEKAIAIETMFAELDAVKVPEVTRARIASLENYFEENEELSEAQYTMLKNNWAKFVHNIPFKV